MAWLMFGETLDALAVAGMVLISVGVALAIRRAPWIVTRPICARPGSLGSRVRTIRVPAIRSCRNCRSGSTSAHR